MSSVRKLPVFIALLAALFWIVPPSAWAADQIGAPYRGPKEMVAAGSGGDTEVDTGLGGDGEGGGGEGGGGEGGGEGGGGEGGGGEGGGEPAPGVNPDAGGGRGGKTAKLDGAILWQWWWEMNRDRFLARSTERGRVMAGSAYYWFGSGAKFPPREISPVSDTLRAGPIYKAIRTNLTHDDARVRAAACIALGRLGNVPAEEKIDGQPDNLLVRDLISILQDNRAGQHGAEHTAAILGIGISGDAQGCEWLMRHQADLSPEERPYVYIAFGLARYLPAIPRLLDAMPSSARARGTTDENIAALHAIGIYGPEAVEALNAEGRGGVARIAKLAQANGDPKVVSQAVATLSRLHQDFKAVVKAMGSKTQGIQWTALLSLTNYYEDEKDAAAAFKALKGRNAFDDGKGQSKVFAVLAMGDLAGRLDPNSKTRANILKFIHEKCLESKKNSYVRGAAAVALGVANDTSAAPAIAELLQEKVVDYVVAGACVGLGLLRATDYAELIDSAVLRDKRWKADARGYGLIGLAMMGDTTRMDEIVKVASDTREKEIRRQMSLAIGVLGDGRHVNTWARYFSKPWKSADQYLASNAAFGLSWIQDPSAVTLLTTLATKSNEAEVRGMATIALGYTGARARVSPITRCFENVSHRMYLSLIHISEPTRQLASSRMPSSA